jgi:hypothetical protein
MPKGVSSAVTDAEFEKLCAEASTFGERLGVSVVLRMVDMRRSPFTRNGVRIMLRILRRAPGEEPQEYSATHGYRPDVKNLRGRIRADIERAADRLHAAR